MHLRWVFSVENAVVLLKNVFEFTLIRLEGFNNKISPEVLACSTWPSGKAWARYVEGPEFHSACNFFSLRFFFSFSFHFRYNSFVMFLYIAYIF